MAWPPKPGLQPTLVANLKYTCMSFLGTEGVNNLILVLLHPDFQKRLDGNTEILKRDDPQLTSVGTRISHSEKRL